MAGQVGYFVIDIRRNVRDSADMNEYTVHSHRFGRYITGHVPLNDLVRLMKAYSEEAGSEAIVATDLSVPLGASMVLTTKQNHAAWRDEVIAHAKTMSGGDPQMEWVLGPFVGRSSLAIMAVMGTTGSAPAVGRLNGHPLHSHEKPTPQDISDWERCKRVIGVLGVTRIDAMAAVSPSWKHIADNIDKMMNGTTEEILHVLEVANGKRR